MKDRRGYTETFNPSASEDEIKRLKRPLGLSDVRKAKLKTVGLLLEARDYIILGEILDHKI